MEEVYQRAQSVNPRYSLWRDRQLSLQETFIFSVNLIQEHYITPQTVKESNLRKDVANIHIYTRIYVQHVYICICMYKMMGRHVNPREIQNLHSQPMVGWPLHLPYSWNLFQESEANHKEGSLMLTSCVLLTCLISVVALYTAACQLLAAIRSLSCYR